MATLTLCLPGQNDTLGQLIIDYLSDAALVQALAPGVQLTFLGSHVGDGQLTLEIGPHEAVVAVRAMCQYLLSVLSALLTQATALGDQGAVIEKIGSDTS